MDTDKLSFDDETELYSRLCTAFELIYHGAPCEGESGYEEASFGMTSDEARRMASAAFRIMGVPTRTPEEVIDRLGPDAIRGILAYREKHGIK